MWPTPQHAWPTTSFSQPGTSSIRTHSSPLTSWSSQSTLLLPGVPHGHPPTHQLYRDHVPPGHPFSTPSTLETSHPHPDPTVYLPSQHNHPAFQPAFGLPPTDPPSMMDHHNETFSDMVRRHPTRPTWASSGGTETSWPAPAPMVSPPVPQPLQPQAPPTSTSAPPPSPSPAPPTSPSRPPATPKRAASHPSRHRMEANLTKTLKNYLNQIQAVVQSSLQPAPTPQLPTPEPPPTDPPHRPASRPRPHHSRSNRHSTPLPRLRHERRSRSRSLRHSRHHSHHRRSPFRPPRIPSRHRRRSPSPRHSTSRRERSQIPNPKHRRTPSADRRRSPRQTTHRRAAPVRREAASSPPNTVYLQSVAARRPSHSDNPPIRLTPNQRPSHQTSLPVRDTTAPLPPPSHPPPDYTPPHDDNFISSARLPDGNTDDSGTGSDADQPYQIPSFASSNSWLADYQWAAKDPSRVKTASELPQSHQWDIVDALPKQDVKEFKHFKDAMYEALAKVHKTSNGSKLRIKVPKDIVDNIANCFARARMLNPDLARRTESFFVEWPHQLFTVAVPTDFDLKDAWATQGNSKYAFYHKTDWSNVPKILSERLIRPADWTRNSDGVPQQFPSYGPFGMACEVHSVKAPLGFQAASQLSTFIPNREGPVECGDHRLFPMS